MQPLHLHHLPKILGLQKKIIDHLTAQNALKYIVPRDEAYFKSHLQSPHQMTGLFDAEQLIAQAIYHNLHQFNPLTHTGYKDIPHLEDHHCVTILQGALVAPEFQGRGLMKNIIGAWLNWANENNFNHAMARTEVTHHASQKAFFYYGFEIAGTIIDARDGASVHVLQKVLRP